MKKVIKLTESDLHNIIKESVNNILSELDWRTYSSAASKAFDMARYNDLDEYEKERRNRQANEFVRASNMKRRKQYDLSKDAYEQVLGYGDANYKPKTNELRRMSQLYQDLKNNQNGTNEYKDGKWHNKEHYK